MTQHNDTRNYWKWEEPSQEERAVDAAGALVAAPAQERQEQPGQAVTRPSPALRLPPSQTAAPPAVRSRAARRRPSLPGLLLALLLAVLFGAVGSVSGFQVNRLVNHHGRATAAAATASGPAPTGTLPVKPTGTPAGSPTPHPTVVSSSPTPQGVILAQDDFQRPNQLLWGVASDGSTWGGDANTQAVFSIAAGAGQITGGQGFFNALLGPRLADESVLYSASVSRFDNLRDNFGAVLRFTNNDSYYKAYLDGQSLILIKRVGGAVTRLGAVPFRASDGVPYTLLFRASGRQLLVRAWPTGLAEPAQWMIAATDSSLTGGWGGLRVLVEPGITVTASDFQERNSA